MASIRKLHRSTLAAAAVAFAACAAPAVGWAGVGLVTTADLYGPWVATLSGVTGCGPTAMHVTISMNNLGTGTATVTTHGQCGNSVLTGQTFKVITLGTNGVGTAGLSCGAGCGWNLRFSISPDRQIMNLVDVDAVNPGNYLAGVAIHY